MEQTHFCQSCGSPMGETNELYGTNADGSKSADYCHYCFKDGLFTADITMNQMIEHVIPYVIEGNEGMTEDQARKMVEGFMPELKRWNQK